jgi:DNA-binding CsgD family transcriptional regulator
MLFSGCIIIHSWPIVQIGLRSVAQSLRIDVRAILSECPDSQILTDWNDSLILIDVQYGEFIQRHQRRLRKRHNSVIGINIGNQHHFDASLFDDILYQADNQNILLLKLNHIANPENKKRNTNQLSLREIDVLKLVALGCSNKQISEKLFISIHTTITHRKHITAKLGVKSISGLTLYAIINNLID